MSTIKKVPVYEEKIECNNCGHTMQAKFHRCFDHKCEVCGEEGCSACMMHFNASDKHFYHKSCSDVLPDDCTNRPYFGKKHVMCIGDLIQGEKYKIRCKNRKDKIIIVLWIEHVQFDGDLIHYKSINGVENCVWPSKIGLSSEAGNFPCWGKTWLEKLQKRDNLLISAAMVEG